MGIWVREGRIQCSLTRFPRIWVGKGDMTAFNFPAFPVS